MRLGDTLLPRLASASSRYLGSQSLDPPVSEPHTHTHTPVGHWGGKGTAPRPIEVRSLRLYSRAQALAARSGSQFLRLRQTITARAIAHDSLRTSEKGPQSPVPFCAKLRPTEPPFLESTRMCKRARATRASGEAAAERLPPPAAPNPDFRSPTFAPFPFAPLFGERTGAPASGPCAPSAAPHQSFFPALPRGWAGARGGGGAAFPAASAAPLVRVPRRRRA